MSLYIRDDEVDALAKRVQRLLGAATKTDAVRIALAREIERSQQTQPLKVRIGRLQAATKALGPEPDTFDMKKFMDEAWDGI